MQCGAEPRHGRSARPTAVGLRTAPMEDVRDQLLAEAPGQRPRAEKEAVVDRAERRIVQQLGIRVRAQLARTHSSPQVGDRGVAPGTDPSVEVLPKNGGLSLV